MEQQEEVFKEYPLNRDYLVGSMGTVYGWYKGHNRRRKIRPRVGNCGYLYLAVIVNGERKHTTIHRMVAQTFIPNPDKLSDVNHRDENKLNNCVDNLEWMSHRDNCNYGNRNKLARDSHVKMWEDFREFMKYHDDFREFMKYHNSDRK